MDGRAKTNGRWKFNASADSIANYLLMNIAPIRCRLCDVSPHRSSSSHGQDCSIIDDGVNHQSIDTSDTSYYRAPNMGGVVGVENKVDFVLLLSEPSLEYCLQRNDQRWMNDCGTVGRSYQRYSILGIVIGIAIYFQDKRSTQYDNELGML